MNHPLSKPLDSKLRTHVLLASVAWVFAVGGANEASCAQATSAEIQGSNAQSPNRGLEQPAEAKALMLINEIARQVIPHTYSNEKDWGKQKEIISGLDVRRDGFRIRTKRRRKKVNHGTWKRYEVRLIDPNRQLAVSVPKLERLENNRLAVDLQVDAGVYLLGRVAQWQRGVQLISVGSDAEAQVRLQVRLEIGMTIDSKKFPPDLVLDAKATQATLKVRDFKLKHVGNLRGTLARELGEELHGLIQKEVDKKSHKIVEKINRAIDKRRDRLRFSVSDTLEKWKLKIED